MILGTFKGEIHIVEIKTHLLIHTFKADGQIKMTPVFDPDNTQIYFGTYNESFYKIHTQVIFPFYINYL